MNLEYAIQKKILIIIIQLLICQHLYAQTEYKLFLPIQDTIQFEKHNHYESLQSLPTISRVAFGQINDLYPEYRYNKRIFDSGKNHQETFSFSQTKFLTDLPDLGFVEHFENKLQWNPGNKTHIDYGAGLAIQNTFMNPYIPNYQLSLAASFKYSFNDWLTAYIYGQYLSRPLNKPDDYFDPFMYNNPTFLQNEVGAGFNARYKNTNIDLQIFSIYGAEYQDVKPVHSKIRIGF